MITDEELLMLRPRTEEPDGDWLSALIAQETAQPEEAAPPDPRARVRELVAQRSAAQPTGPGEHESAYASAVEKPQDGNRWLAVLGSLLSGHDFVADRDARRAQYQEGLLKAREQDSATRRAGRPVDAPTAEMATIAGLSPESAAELREDSPALKLFNNLGMIQTRQRGQDLAHEEKQRALESRTSDLEKRLAVQKEIAGGHDETSLERQRIANAGKKGKGGGPAAPLSPEQEAEQQGLLASHLHRQLNTISREKALAFLQGNTEGLTPEQTEALQSEVDIFRGMDGKQRSQVLAAGSNREASNLDKPIVSARVKIEDPKEQLKLRQEVGSVGADIAAADQAWRNLSPAAKQAIATLGGQGGFIAGQLQKMALSEKDQAAKSQLQALANTLIKARAGSAVTGTEWNRVATEIGFAQEDFDLLNSPASIEAWLAKSKSAWARQVNDIKSVYGQDFFKKKAAPGG